jgi:hypothetical protein
MFKLRKVQNTTLEQWSSSASIVNASITGGFSSFRQNDRNKTPDSMRQIAASTS